MMTRCHGILALSLCTFLNVTHAGTIQVGQWIPWNFISQEFNAVPLNVQVREPVMNLNIGEFTPVLKNLDISISGESFLERISADGIRSSQNLSADISIGGLIIDQVIKREINGNELSVHIKASCRPFSILVKKIDARTRFNFTEDQNYWRPELSQLDFDLASDDWSVGSVQCEGIGGLGDEIATEIKGALSNPQIFKEMIKNLLAEQMRFRIQGLWGDLISDTSRELTVTGIKQPSARGVIILAQMTTKRASFINLPYIQEDKLSTVHPQFLMSVRGFESILEDKVKDLAPQNYNLQEVSGFKKLMKSRIKQLFAWPDLRRFSSSHPFWLSTYLDQFQLRLFPKANNEWTANLQTNGVINTEIGTSPIDYILLGLGISTEFKIEVVDGKLTFSNGAAEMNMYWDYGIIYQLIYRPNRYIGVKLLKSAIKPFFSHQTITQDLPMIEWNNRKLKLQNWHLDEELISMDWL